MNQAAISAAPIFRRWCLRLQPAFGVRLAVIVVTAASFCSCSNTKSPATEAPPAPPLAQANQPDGSAQLPAPELVQVNEAVKRVFKDSVSIDAAHQPAFVVGDFNGDESQDIAVVLKPNAAKLSELNEEFPNWVFRDLKDKESRAPRLRVTNDDVLLAVIHGYGQNGWRDPQATQTFLLKNAAGTNLETRSPGDFQNASATRQPGLRGDVVAQELAGRSGYLYFSNLTYAWYDPKTFAGEPERRRGHGGNVRGR